MNYPNPIDKNIPCIFGDDVMPLRLPMATIVPIDMSPGRRLTILNDIPDYRIDFADVSTAERFALWVKFDNLAFDPSKHDSGTIKEAIYKWLSKICGTYKINEMKLTVINACPDSYKFTPSEDNIGRSDRAHLAYSRVAHDLFNAIANKQCSEIVGDNAGESSCIRSRGPRTAARYEFSIGLGHGLWFMAAERGRLDEFVRPIHSVAPDFKIKPMGTFFWFGKPYDFYINHPLLEGQILDRLEKDVLQTAFHCMMEDRFPLIQTSLGDFLLDFAD